jgi:hypothetical protein
MCGETVRKGNRERSVSQPGRTWKAEEELGRSKGRRAGGTYGEVVEQRMTDDDLPPDNLSDLLLDVLEFRCYTSLPARIPRCV